MYNRNYSDKNIAFLFTIKNRTKLQYEDGEILSLLGNCLSTLFNSLENFSFKNVDFYFADFHSNDCILREYLINKYKVPYNFHIFHLDGPFGRGPGFNVLLKALKDKYDCLCFLDADMLFTRENILDRAFHNVLIENKAYFPVCLRLMEDGRTKEPEFCGYGNCFVPPKIILENNITFIEKFTWGQEDTFFYESIKNYCETIQEVVPGFYHQWHPR